MKTMHRTEQPPTPDREIVDRQQRRIATNFDESFDIEGGEEAEPPGWFGQPATTTASGTAPPAARTRRRRRPLRRHLLQNRTPYLIRITNEDSDRYGELVIPPLAERVVAGSRLEPFTRQLRIHRQRHEVCVRPYREERRSIGSWLLLISLLGLLGVIVWDFLYRGTILRTEFWIALAVAVLTWSIVLGNSTHGEDRRRRQMLNTDSEEGDIAAGMGIASVDANETARRGFHYLVLLLVVTIGAVLPSIAILVATDAYKMVDLEGGFEVNPDAVSPFTSRVIQMIYVSILSLFPALMYFQFDRQRVGTIWGQWVRAIFRMDGRMRTLADVHARYGDDLVEASNNSAKSVRYLGGNHSPIVIATVLIALGWTVLVLQTESFHFDAVVELRQQEEVLAAAEASAEASRDEAETADDLADAQTAVARSESAVETAEEAGAQSEEIADGTLTGEDGDSAVGGSPNGEQGANPDGDDPPPEDGEATGGPTGDSGDGSSAETSGETDPSGRADTDETSTEASTIEEARQETQDNLEAVAAEGELAAGARREVLSTDYFQLLVPRPSAAAMAFLGAYFFAVYLVLRSYFRGDLRPKLYNQITARLVTVVVLAYLINVLLVDAEQHTIVWTIAFFAGVVPQTMLKWITTRANAATGRIFRRELSEGRPLSQIDGVDFYDRNVLEAEGVSDVPALANCDVASLMMRSRLPIEQLVDWADQAVRMTVLHDTSLTATGSQYTSRTDTDDADDDAQGYRIRTASDHMAHCGCGAFSHDRTALTQSATDSSSPAGDSPAACETCAAMQRLAAWPRIEEWRTSDLARLDAWVPLPPWLDSQTDSAAGSNGSEVSIGATT